MNHGRKKNLWFTKHHLFLNAKNKKRKNPTNTTIILNVKFYFFLSLALKIDILGWQKPKTWRIWCHIPTDVCAQSCLILCDPVDCSPPGSSVYGIFQARILEWVTISYSRGSSWPRDWIHVSCVSCIAYRFFTAEPLGKLFTSYLHIICVCFLGLL